MKLQKRNTMKYKTKYSLQKYPRPLQAYKMESTVTLVHDCSGKGSGKVSAASIGSI